MSRALILSCSRAKVPDRGLLTAIERYDGPAFRVLRRFLRQTRSSAPVVKIISAEFGLLDGHQPLDFYDRQMTDSRAEELQGAVASAFAALCESNEIKSLMVLASATYRRAMALCWDLLDKSVAVHIPSGGIGGKISTLKHWLYCEPLPSLLLTPQETVTLRGITISATADKVIALAREGCDEPDASRFETWCVSVDGKKVAPKWVVSRLSGLPVAAFRTADAVSVLRRLGVHVERVFSTDCEQIGMKGRR